MRKLFITVALISCFVVGLAAAAGLEGKWKGSMKDPDGNDHPFRLVFNVDDGKLTGTTVAEGVTLTINNGKVDGDNFSFSLTDPDGNVATISGKYIAAGDSISFNLTENNMKHHTTFVREGN